MYMYETDDELTVSFAVEFGNNEFQTHCTDSRNCLFFLRELRCTP